MLIEHGSDPKSDEGPTPVYGSGTGSFKTCMEYKEGPTVLLGRKGTIDCPQYIEGRYWNVDTAFNVAKTWGVLLKFYYYLSLCFTFDKYATKTTLPSMTQSDYLNMFLPVPPLNEQEAIVLYLEQRTEDIDRAILQVEIEISKLSEYRSSITYECVTGKKRIR